RGERATLAAGGADLGVAAHLLHLVGAEAALAVGAVHHRVGEDIFMAGRLPDTPRHQDAGVQAHHIIAHAGHRIPPVALDVILELDAEGAVVEDRVDSAVDFAAGENITAPFAQRDNVLHAVVTVALVHTFLLPAPLQR